MFTYIWNHRFNCYAYFDSAVVCLGGTDIRPTDRRYSRDTSTLTAMAVTVPVVVEGDAADVVFSQEGYAFKGC